MKEQKRLARTAVVELYRSRWQLDSFRTRDKAQGSDTPNGHLLGAEGQFTGEEIRFVAN